jgi:hypothetical protein
MGGSKEESTAGERYQYLGLEEGKAKMGVGQSRMKYSGFKSGRWHIVVFPLPSRLSPPLTVVAVGRHDASL